MKRILLLITVFLIHVSYAQKNKNPLVTLEKTDNLTFLSDKEKLTLIKKLSPKSYTANTSLANKEIVNLGNTNANIGFALYKVAFVSKVSSIINPGGYLIMDVLNAEPGFYAIEVLGFDEGVTPLQIRVNGSADVNTEMHNKRLVFMAECKAGIKFQVWVIYKGKEHFRFVKLAVSKVNF